MDKLRIVKDVIKEVFDKTVDLPAFPVIDGAAGIYAYNELVRRYSVLVETDFEGRTIYKPLDEYLVDYGLAYPEGKVETLETIFSPDNDDYLDNIISFEDKLFVRGDNGVFYRLVSDNGDIFAVDPRAEYDEETGGYYFPEEENDEN